MFAVTQLSFYIFWSKFDQDKLNLEVFFHYIITLFHVNINKNMMWQTTRRLVGFRLYIIETVGYPLAKNKINNSLVQPTDFGDQGGCVSHHIPFIPGQSGHQVPS